MEAIARSRDREAFAALFTAYAPRLRAYLRRGGLDPSAAEEILQEVMLVIWDRADRYQPAQAAVSTWIFTIARNRRIDRLRRAARPEPEADDPHFRPSAPAAPDTAAAAHRRAVRLQAALDSLPPEQTEILHLMYFEGCPQSLIAERLGLPAGTVKSRVRLAMRRLREQLAEEGEAP